MIEMREITSPVTYFSHYQVNCMRCRAATDKFDCREKAEEAWNQRATLECGVFDRVEEYKNCTVQLCKNSMTGESGVMWRQNDDRQTEDYDY